MDTNALLRKHNYHLRSDFSDIAKYAAKVNDLTSEEVVINLVSSVFGPPPEVVSLEKYPGGYSVLGSSLITQDTLEQMDMVVSIPPAINGALMPDAHLGYGMPIGGVVELKDAVSPSFVGYDISCMMALSVLSIDPELFLENIQYFKDALVDSTRFGIGAEYKKNERLEHDILDDERWNHTNILRGLKDLAWSQLGTSGSGNHFADLMIIEFVKPFYANKPGDKFVALLTHSGSRGPGHKFASHYMKKAEEYIGNISDGSIPRGYEWLDINTQDGQEYLNGMELMGDYAVANHSLIHERFTELADVNKLFWAWNRHNYAWETESGYLHRKGATPADKGRIGLIPGSSGTNSYMVMGCGNETYLNSSSHGAGRPYSRSKAKEYHDQRAVDLQMRDIVSVGVAEDETYQAYKDIEMVMSYQSGITVDIVAKMTPKVVVMGGA